MNPCRASADRAAAAAGEEMEPLEQPKPKPKRVIRKRAKLTLEQLQVCEWVHTPWTNLNHQHPHTHCTDSSEPHVWCAGTQRPSRGV